MTDTTLSSTIQTALIAKVVQDELKALETRFDDSLDTELNRLEVELRREYDEEISALKDEISELENKMDRDIAATMDTHESAYDHDHVSCAPRE